MIVVEEIDNMEAPQNARIGLLGGAEWESLRAKIDVLSRGIHRRRLSALPYIKMKQCVVVTGNGKALPEAPPLGRRFRLWDGDPDLSAPATFERLVKV